MELATGQSYCPNCGTPLQPHAVFCPTCGTKIISSQTQQQVPPIYYHPATSSQAPVSTGPYKAVIGILLVIIILLGVGLYGATSGHLFSLTGYRYTLANPPSYQSTLPAPAPTSQSPQTITWNACGSTPAQGCNMTGNGWREGTIPDTYDYYVTFSSTVPVAVYFFTLGQFVQYVVCNGQLSCVSPYYDSLPATTNQQTVVFRLAEGCGDYVAIFVASGTGVMYPNIGVTRPSTLPNGPTGYCGQSGNS